VLGTDAGTTSEMPSGDVTTSYTEKKAQYIIIQNVRLQTNANSNCNPNHNHKFLTVKNNV